MAVPKIALHNGAFIPQIGFGVFQIPSDQTATTVATALEVGYRHIDTAQMYGNESGVGDAVRASGIPRNELFITSKLGNGSHLPRDAVDSFAETLRLLRLDYVDLFLIHWPLPTRYGGDFVSTWEMLTSFVQEGRAASVGVSNFQPAHLERLIAETSVVPVVNQVEVHPHFANVEVRAANASHGIATQAWSPIAKGTVLTDPVIASIAAARGRTPSQVTLRWHVQKGHVALPKTVRRERMEENLAVFDFVLSDDDMAAIDSLNKHAEGRIGFDPDVFDYVPQ